MGYNTKFSGALQLSRPLTIAEAKVILEANQDPDTINEPHPKSYMQWVPTHSLDEIVYDGNEKFYEYDKWLVWLLAHLDALGVTASGEIFWQGESVGDAGTLSVKDGVLTVAKSQGSKSGAAKPLTLDDLARIALEQVTKTA
jgi:hypothetical protein